MRRQRVWDDSGRPLALGARLGRGGEGSVYAVAGDGAHVAKLCHRLPGAQQAAKVETMVRLKSDRLLALAAWPIATLHASPGGALRGLLLPRAEGRPDLADPSSHLGASGRAGDERFDLRIAWARITAIPPPRPHAAEVSCRATALPPSRRAVRARLRRTVARALAIGLLGGLSCASLAVLDEGWGFAVMVFVILAGGSLGLLADLVWRRALAADARAAVIAFEHRLLALEASWREASSGSPFDAALRRLEESRRAYLLLAAARRSRAAAGSELAAARAGLEGALRDAPRRLWEIKRHVIQQRRSLPPQIAALRHELAQAESDLRAIGG
jgi:hypothetical protein